MTLNITELVQVELSKILPDLRQSISDEIRQELLTPKTYLSRKETADYLGVCLSTIDNYARIGYLPKRKIGSSTRFHIEDIKHLLSNQLKRA